MSTIPVTLPALGEAIENATISTWLKGVGDNVVTGEPLVEVSTDKVDTEVESPATGVLLEIHATQDDQVDVGAIIAIISDSAPAPGEAGEPTPPDPSVDTAAPAANVTPAEPAAKLAPGMSSAAPAPSAIHTSPMIPSASTHPPVSFPAPEPARAGHELATPSPSAAPVGSDNDSEVSSERSTAHLPGTTQKMNRLRKTIANRMVESLQISAQLTTIVEVDVTEVGRVRRRHNKTITSAGGVKLSYLPFIAVAALEALRVFPQMNCTVDLDAGTITYPITEHLGIAVDTDKGLFVPVIRDVRGLTVTELASRIADVADRTRTNRITVDELSGGTFTITNTGSRGALMDTPIINQPQVAILGAGVVARRPVTLGREGMDESIAVRSMLYLSLTYDHRVVDGADAARYLTAVKGKLEGDSFEL